MVKPEIRGNSFLKANPEIIDGSLKNTLKDFSLSRKNEIKNIGYDFRGNVLTRTLSNTIIQEPKRQALLAMFELMINYLIDSVKYIKKHNNFAIPKKWRDFN